MKANTASGRFEVAKRLRRFEESFAERVSVHLDRAFAVNPDQELTWDVFHVAIGNAHQDFANAPKQDDAFLLAAAGDETISFDEAREILCR